MKEVKNFSEWLDQRAKELQLEIAKIGILNRVHMADLYRFQNRSAGQVRRFEVARKQHTQGVRK